MRWLICTFVGMRILVLLLLFSISAVAQENISIITSQENQDNPISGAAIRDVQKLLEQACQCEVDINKAGSKQQIILPDIDAEKAKEPTEFEENTTSPYLHYPKHWYTWSIGGIADTLTLKLETPTYVGLSNALYGLLQERLGFKFYHPKETFIPRWDKLPVERNTVWQAQPRFDKAGFHLHTQHPLELTEPLLDHEFPQGIELVKEYIDWLARNGQNYFEFNLLESIDLKEWPEFSKQMVDYCHERGVIAGVDVSLHMLQQKAFQLYRNWPASWRSKQTQITKRTAMLFAADWDVLNVEFSSTEFTSGNVKKKKRLQLHLGKLLSEEHGAKLMGRKHVVKETEELGGKKKKKKKKDYEMSEEEAALDKKRGVLIHTVMFYTISEEKAPVYQNENLRHMLDEMMKEKDVRETWYYPESAYWVTFDSSIPLFLLPYLSGRLDDILLMDSLQIPGHITFSSGWEWGYWLFDWSIARWSWKHSINREEQEVYPTMFIEDMFDNEQVTEFFKKNVALQDEYLKDKELMRYMTAMTVTDELPEKFALEFHPRPKHHYEWMAKKAPIDSVRAIRERILPVLDEFIVKTKRELDGFKAGNYYTTLPDEKRRLLDEMVAGTEVLLYRALHRKHTLSYLLNKRESKLLKDGKDHSELLTEAATIRNTALQIVREQEARYRYDVERMTTKFKDHTSYRFGYLYPVHDLHFWKREEEQYRRNKFSPFFMSIWNVYRIIGIIN